MLTLSVLTEPSREKVHIKGSLQDGPTQHIYYVPSPINSINCLCLKDSLHQNKTTKNHDSTMIFSI